MLVEATAAPVGVIGELAWEDEDHRSLLQFGIRTDQVGFIGYMGRGEASVIFDQSKRGLQFGWARLGLRRIPWSN
ncbi:hypothetical protein B1H26_21830 [Amycolatopsis sp. BJA-103]|nr:hypothetical protein BKN51_12725 [Amycolatopsis sp. BJA-103]PNE17561.1 hypothetical protein B1H26_21830 [Amycolatopsis sp. BJA-103]